MNIETERKFLMKGLPNLNYDKIVQIKQDYFIGDGESVSRVRLSSNNNDIIYTYTKKTPISKGSNYEDEYEIPVDEYYKLLMKTRKTLNKTRHVYSHNNHKFEIDVFSNGMIMMEVEMEELGDIDFPEEIEGYIEREVTGDSRYSNYNLSKISEK